MFNHFWLLMTNRLKKKNGKKVGPFHMDHHLDGGYNSAEMLQRRKNASAFLHSESRNFLLWLDSRRISTSAK